jgi:hypothetical protein
MLRATSVTAFSWVLDVRGRGLFHCASPVGSSPEEEKWPNQLTPWSRDLLETLTVSQLVKKFPTLYGTRRFITTFTRARHLSLSWASSIQSMPQSHFLKIYFNIILPSTPGSPKWSPSLGSPHQNPVCTFFPPYVLHAPPISFFSICLPE